MISNKARFVAAINKFEEINREGPNVEMADGKYFPKEVLYAHRMADCLNEIAPEASEALQLAVRCQHIRRWAISRQDFPVGIDGYNKWRNSLKKYHAALAGEILNEVGYDDELIQRVQFLVQKRQLKIDVEVQLLEDVICLVFLRYYFLPFAQQHPEEKVLDIVQKTWNKMTPAGHKLALQLALPESAQQLITKALAA